MPTDILKKFFAAFRSWGGPGEGDDDKFSPDTGEHLDLYVQLQNDDRLLVGTLRKEGEEYIFSYSDDFKSRTHLPAISSFPRRNEIYRSKVLFPFFEVRLPPATRPDVEKILREQAVDTSNTFQMLALLGRRTVSNPYELDYHVGFQHA